MKLLAARAGRNDGFPRPSLSHRRAHQDIPASSSSFSALPAAANRRCSIFLAVSMCPRPGRRRSQGAHRRAISPWRRLVRVVVEGGIALEQRVSAGDKPVSRPRFRTGWSWAPPSSCIRATRSPIGRASARAECADSVFVVCEELLDGRVRRSVLPRTAWHGGWHVPCAAADRPPRRQPLSHSARRGCEQESST